MKWLLQDEITIEGNPVAKGRPRVTRTHAFTPKKTKLAQQIIRNEVEMHCSDDPLWPFGIDSAIWLDVTFIFQRPKRLLRNKDPDSRMWKTTKPDLDNLLKLVKDAINDSGWWCDDKCVQKVTMEKLWASKTEAPKTIIKLYLPEE